MFKVITNLFGRKKEEVDPLVLVPALLAAAQVDAVTYRKGPDYVRFSALFEQASQLDRLALWLEHNNVLPGALEMIYDAEREGQDEVALRIPYTIMSGLVLPLVLATKKTVAVPIVLPQDQIKHGPEERQALVEKATWLMKRTGCAPCTAYEINGAHVVFSVPASIAWSLEPLTDYLNEARALYALPSASEKALVWITREQLLALPQVEKPSKWDGDMSPEGQRVLRREILAEIEDVDEGADEEDEDHSDDEDDGDEAVGITVAEWRRFQAIEAAAQKVLNSSEYRVNHIFKGESASFYVRQTDLNDLRNAVETKV